MIYIGICDDDSKHQKIIYDEISKILFQHDDVEFVYYSSGKEVISEIEKETFSCELLILDINMPEINGLETAAYIRENRIDVDIIFWTISQEHVFEGYKYNAFSYLLKPLDTERLYEELERYIASRKQTSHCLHVNISGKKVQIFLDKVLYFMTEGRKIIVFQKVQNEEIAFYAKMNDLEETLSNDGFIRCHQSYLVNKKYIKAYSRTEIDLGNEVLPISRKYVEKIRESI